MVRRGGVTDRKVKGGRKRDTSVTGMRGRERRGERRPREWNISNFFFQNSGSSWITTILASMDSSLVSKYIEIMARKLPPPH